MNRGWSMGRSKGESGMEYKKAIPVFLALLAMMSLMRILTSTAAGSPSWWDSNWTKRRQITVGAHPENYQIKVIIPNDIPKSDYPSIRFLEDENSGLLPYWIEKVENSYSNVAWVRRLENSDDTIYMYYGNSNATSAENGDDTFLFFDDFGGGTGGQGALNTSKWQEKSGTGVDVYATTLRLEDWNNEKAYVQHQFPESETNERRIVEFRIKNSSSWRGGVRLYGTDDWGSGDGREMWCIFRDGWPSGPIKFFSESSPDGWTDIELEGSKWYVGGLVFYGDNKNKIGAYIYYGEDNENYRQLVGSKDPTGPGWTWSKDSGGWFIDKYKPMVWDGGGDSSYYYDWFIVRKWAATEPSVVVGEEERLNTPPNIPENLMPSARQTTTDVKISADVRDNDGDDMNVFFFDNSTDNLIDNVWVLGGSRIAEVWWRGLERGITYTFRVTAIDNRGAASENSIQSFRVNAIPTRPTSLILTSPIKVGRTLSAVASGSMDNDNDNLTYYYMFYNENDGQIRQDWSTNNTYTVGADDNLDNIVVYVRAFDSYENSENFENSVMVSESAPPGAPIPTSPDNGSSSCDNTPTFSWTPGGDAENHYLLIDNDPYFDPPFENIALGAEDNSYTLADENSLPDGIYYWMVVAVNEYGETPSPTFIFTIDTVPPNPPELVHPDNNFTENTFSVVFTWTEPEPGVVYHIQIDNEDGFVSPYVHENTGVTENSYPYVFQMSGTYYWRVRAQDVAGNWSEWSDNFGLTISAAAFGIPPRFVQYGGNPIMSPMGSGWESSRVYNPSVIFENGIFHMLYRAENGDGISGRIGYAWSTDGFNFTRYGSPVLVPSEDYDVNGCEDPRVVKIGDKYYMTYAGNDGDNANVCLATSSDLINWTKLGETVQPAHAWNGYQIKAGAIVPQKIGDYYYMFYMGENQPWRGKIGLARATDIDNVLTWEDYLDHPVLEPRPGPYFDNTGVEPGAVYILDNAILLIYNGWCPDPTAGSSDAYTHRTGWVLFSKDNLEEVLARCDNYIIEEYVPYSSVRIAFSESICYADNKWYIHYGIQDTWIGVAVYDTTTPPAAEWWDSGWTYRRPIAVFGSHPENHQLRIVIPPEIPKNLYPSIRFLENENGGVLPYWIERDENDYLNVAWVRRLENSDDTIWMYYGNSNATSAENGDDVFLFFDDFGGGNGGQGALNKSKWGATSGGIDVWSNTMQITDWGNPGNSNANRVEHGPGQGIQYLNEQKIIEFRVRPSQWWRGGLGLNGPGSFYEDGAAQQYAEFFKDGGAYKFFSDGSWSPSGYTQDKWYIGRVDLYTDNKIMAKFYWGEDDEAYRTLCWIAPEKTRNWNPDTDSNNYCDKYVLAAWDSGGDSSYYYDWFFVRSWTSMEPANLVGEEQSLTPLLRSPENGTVISDNTPTLTWIPGTNALRHYLLLDNGLDFNPPLENIPLGPENNTYTIADENAIQDGTYYWMVVAINEFGESPSDVWTFTVDTTPPQVVHTTPENNENGVWKTQVVRVRFSESMDTSVTPTLSQTGGTGVSYTFAGWSTTVAPNDTAEWSHDSWKAGEKITLEVSGFRDPVGNTGDAHSWSFNVVSEGVYPPEVMACYVLENVEAEVYYNFRVEIRDNDNLPNVGEIWLKLYESSKTEGSADDLESHYTFKWVRGAGFSEVGPGTSNEHIRSALCSAGSGSLTTDNWVFRVKLDQAALSGDWSVWVKVVDAAENEDEEEFEGKFTVIPCNPPPVLSLALRPPFLENEWVKNSKPVLIPDGSGFDSYAAYNPAVVIENGKFYMFYRAQPSSGGTSYIGMAVSEDGIKFQTRENPVIAPTSGWYDSSGCEDPRIHKVGDEWWITYTAYDGTTPRLALATSRNLENWTKGGLVFSESWMSKSGGIVGEYRDGAVHPAKINGKYWMYYEHVGMGDLYYATSEDLHNWTFGTSWILMERRAGYFDAGSIEVGPPPMLMDNKILIIYNSLDRALGEGGSLCVGWAVASGEDPSQIISRCEEPFLQPEYLWENSGQVPRCVFAGGFVESGGQWWVYYGAADMMVGLARAPVRERPLWAVGFKSEWSGGTMENLVVTSRPSGIMLSVPVGWWSFDEGSGSVAHDSSEFGNDGTIYNASSTPRNGDNALSFDGSSGYVDVGDRSSLEGLSGLTITAWVNPSSKPQNATIVKKDEVYLLRMNTGENSDYTAFMIWTSPNEKYMLYIPDTHFPNNQWSMITAVWDGSQVRIYKDNGALLTDAQLWREVSGTRTSLPSWQVTADRLNTSAHNLYIGGDPAHGEWFHGGIDEVMIFGRALSENEIEALYQSGEPSVRSGTWSSDWHDLGGWAELENLWVSASIGATEGAKVAVEVSHDGVSTENTTGWVDLADGANEVDLSSLPACRYVRVTFELDTNESGASPSIAAFAMNGSAAKLLVTTGSVSYSGDDNVRFTGTLVNLENEETFVWFRWKKVGSSDWKNTDNLQLSWRMGFSAEASGLEEGEQYEFMATAFDSMSGAVVFGRTLTFVMDKTPPSVFSLLYPENDAWLSEFPTLVWEASSDNGSGLSHYEVWLDGANVENVTENSYATSELSGGIHEWYVVAVDRLGNRRQSDKTFTFHISSPPAPFNLISPSGSYTLENRVILLWENTAGVASPLRSYEVWIDDSKVVSLDNETTSYMTLQLSQGMHEWYVVAVDNVGLFRESENRFIFYIGPPPPYPYRYSGENNGPFTDGFESGSLEEYENFGIGITGSAIYGSYSAIWNGLGDSYAYRPDIKLGYEEGKVSVIFRADNVYAKPGVGFISADGEWVCAVAYYNYLRVERRGKESVYATTPEDYWKNKNQQPLYNWGSESYQNGFYNLDVERVGISLESGHTYRMELSFSRRSRAVMASIYDLSTGSRLGVVRTVVDIAPEHPFFLARGPVRLDNFYFNTIDDWVYNWEPLETPLLIPTDGTWDARGAFNPAAGFWENQLRIVYRGNSLPAPGASGGVPASDIGYAVVPENVLEQFVLWLQATKHPTAVLTRSQTNCQSVEDPDLLINPFGDNWHYMEATVFNIGGDGAPHSRIFKSQDFITWTYVSEISSSVKTAAIVDMGTDNSNWIDYQGTRYRFFTYGEPTHTIAFSNNLINWTTDSLGRPLIGRSDDTWADLGDDDTAEIAAGAWPVPDGLLVLTCMSTSEGYVGGDEATVGTALMDPAQPWNLLERATLPWAPVYHGAAPTSFADLSKDNRSWASGPNFPGCLTIGPDNWLYALYGTNDQFGGIARTRLAPEFEFRELCISNLQVYENEKFVVSVVARNVGNLSGSENVRLYVNGELRDSQIVYLARDNENTVEFELSENGVGLYVVQVGDLTFTVQVISKTKPTLLSPRDGARTFCSGPTLEWMPGLNVDNHRLLVDNDPGLTSPVKNILLGPTENKYLIETPLNDGAYYWRIIAIVDSNEDASDTWTFSVETLPPQLFSPENNKTDNGLTQSLAWTWPGPAVTFHIQIDNELSFTSPHVHENQELTENSYVFTFPGNGTYYWRVRGRDEIGEYSAWSDNFKLTVSGASASKPSLLKPENGTYINDNTPTFTWVPGANAENHRLLLGKDPDFASPTENVLLGAENGSYTLENSKALPDRIYYWKVVAIGGSAENSSDVWVFGVDTLPPLPFNLISPQNGVTLTTNRPTFVWENSSDNFSGLKWYEVWIDGKNVDNVTSENGYVASMLSEGSHSWYIVAVDNAGNRQQSTATFTFVVRVTKLTSYVDPFIGTMYGHTNPGSTVPFAMTSWEPVRKVQASGIDYPYEYDITEIAGFRGSHFPSGSCMSDYACVTLMPELGSLVLGPSRASSFSHQNEVASPGYYAVTLDRYGVRAELTSTVRCGIMKFTFSQAGTAHVLIDAHLGTGYVKILPESNEIVGYSDVGQYRGPTNNFKGYFVIKFNKPFSSYGTWEQGTTQHLGSTEITAYSAGGWATFSVSAGETIMVKASISFISIDQARTNMNTEIPGWDFDSVRSAAEDTWERELGKIEVVGGTQAQKTVFYTALYHTLLTPRVSSEYGKYWSVFDAQVHTLPSGHEFYNDFSMWDIFRSEWAQLILLVPDRVADMCQSLVYMYEQGGWMPKWPNPGYSNIMIGTHGDSLITEAYLNGVTGFDVQKAYEGMLKNATQTPPSFYEARTGITDYMSLHYCPSDAGYPESVSMTLEYAYDDWCIAQLAKALGKTSDYNTFIARAGYYANVFDNSVGFVRGRKSDGTWAGTSFDPTSFYSWMCQPNEGDPWQYTWFVPHDVWGLIQLVNGSKNNTNYPGDFNQKLDTLFQKSEEPGLIAENQYAEHGTVRYYWHGNEPGQHIAYLFNYSGQPWKTQYWVDYIMKTRYRTYPYGLPGNDDGGQLSSWYVFSAMGFYPVNPSSLTYVIGRPIFEKVTLHLPNGKNFVITADGVSDERMYIQSAALNGLPLTKPWFSRSTLTKGGTLGLVMGSSPNYDWGTHPSHAPPSMNGPKFVVENLNISPVSVSLGENVEISVKVTNVGNASGSKLVELILDASVADKKEATLGVGESKVVSFVLRPDQPGLHVVYIEELQGVFEVAAHGVVFLVENLVIEPERVYVGENVTISVTVVNIGENSGTKYLALFIDNLLEATENVTLAPGESKTVSFTIFREEPGTYWVRIENLTGYFIVEVPGGLPSFIVKNLRLSPKRVEPGEEVSVSVDVSNVGDAYGENVIELKVDGSVADTKTISLGPRSSTVVTFVVGINEPGFHLIEVNRLNRYLLVLSSTGARIVTCEVGDIPAGGTKKIELEEGTITWFVITARNQISGESIEILEFENPPAGISDGPSIAYRYLIITPQVSEDDDVENVLIGFRVSRAWISEKSIDAKTLCLFRYNENGEWVELPTEKVDEDEEYVYFEATSPTFSVYAIFSNSQAGFPLPVIPLGGVGILAAAIGGYFVLSRRSASALKRRKRMGHSTKVR